MTSKNKKREREPELDFGEATVNMMNDTLDFLEKKHPKHPLTKAWKLYYSSANEYTDEKEFCLHVKEKLK